MRVSNKLCFLTLIDRIFGNAIIRGGMRSTRMSSTASRKRTSSDDGTISPPPPSKRIAKQTSTTTVKAVANFFTPASQKAKIPEKVSWRTIDSSLIVGRYNVDGPAPASGKRKVAAFDFDSTLIGTISKLKFSKDANDWCWWHGIVPAKLKALHESGYTLIVVSNQNGISLRSNNGPKITKNNRFTQFKQKATAVFTALDLPISLYAATEKDVYRKPATGMWQQFLRDHELESEDIDLVNSLFVGDAGGRTAGKGRDGKTYKADFSCSDRNFATNVGLDFHTPEEYFLGEDPREFVRSFDPASYLAAMDRLPFEKASVKELVVFVGFPGAGKSTFFRKTLEPLGYERVNQDTLKSREKCLKFAADYLSHGKSVTVDNTNADREVRKVWIAFAKQHNVPVRCIYFTASKELARHNAAVRARSGLAEMNPETRENLPDLAFNSFASRFQEPTLEEGFSEIIHLNFAFDGSEDSRALWSKYWT